MKFIVDKEVFGKLTDVCFLVIAAKNIDNSKNIEEIENILKENILQSEKYFEDKKVKECEDILCYREAFNKLNINPNKYMCSIEALLTRISKKKGMPFINPVVDLVNAISIKYRLPMGAHDLDSMDNEDLCVRFSKNTDHFLPFGEKDIEKVEEGELVYVSGSTVRTRKWIWRQSEEGKIIESSKNIFFPIDAFKNINDENALKAREELLSMLKRFFNCELMSGFVDKTNNSFDIL